MKLIWKWIRNWNRILHVQFQFQNQMLPYGFDLNDLKVIFV
jgi:hypothetical protein